jgi:ribosome-binding factor A
MPALRLQRIGELLKRELGEILRRDFPAHEVGLISVNEVEVAGDLQSARVFVSVLGTVAQQKLAMQMLAEKRKQIQGRIGRDLALKYTPVLTFVKDDSIEKGNRVLQIIEELEQDDSGKNPA